MITQCPVPLPKWKLFNYHQEVLERMKLNLPRSSLCHVKLRVSLRYFVNDCPLKHSFACTSPQSSSNCFSFTILVTQGFSHSFNLQLKQLSCKKVLKFAFFGNCFSDPFTEVQMWYLKNLKNVLEK